MASNVLRMTRQHWHCFDASDQVVGRLAAQCAKLLIGKHKPTYSPNASHQGDFVVVYNARKLKFTGAKFDKKLYRWHTGYRLKQQTPKELAVIKNKPEEVFLRAVSGMLPKNNLRKARMKRLHVIADEEHQFKDQVQKYKPHIMEQQELYKAFAPRYKQIRHTITHKPKRGD